MRDSDLKFLCDPYTEQPVYLEGSTVCTVAATGRHPVRDGVSVFAATVGGATARYQRLYDRLSSFYDSALALARWWMGDFRCDYLQELEIKSGHNVLEVSVSKGDNLPHLREDIRFTGIDISWKMLRRARRNVRRWGREADLFQGGERLPFRTSVFEVVFHVGGIDFLDDPGQAIQDARAFSESPDARNTARSLGSCTNARCPLP